jgi:hypothetical protein
MAKPDLLFMSYEKQKRWIRVGAGMTINGDRIDSVRKVQSAMTK